MPLRRQPVDCPFSTRKGWVRDRPLIRPSVRTGAPSPQGEGFGGMSLIWKPSFPKMLFSIFYPENASQIGFGIPEEIVPLSYQGQRSPKRANGSERALNPGVQGRSPGPLSSHFSGEMGTPAGQAGQRGAAPLTPKPASGNERAIKKRGGRGASPRNSLRPGFL